MKHVEQLRLKFALLDTLPQLSLLGAISGLIAGGVIVLFRLGTESLQAAFLSHPENYEALSPLGRVIAPLLSVILILFLARLLRNPPVGIVHVMERLAYQQGRMPLRNMIYQFFGALFSIAGGHSVGREGPSVHLGAASGSLFGQSLQLPHNSIRTLAACGTAAAIGASFNTPLAGVIFAMEVVMMEYTISTFTPVILAAVTGTLLSRAVFGAEIAFIVPALPSLFSLQDLVYLVLVGMIIGICAAGFIHSMEILTRFSQRYSLGRRLLLAGLMTALIGSLIPQVMGICYDTLNGALGGLFDWRLLALIALAKFVLSAINLGLGIPGGLIGPQLVIGGCIGGALGLLGHYWWPEYFGGHALYVLLGMTAMMSATLQAPLAALTAILELTANPVIILPGMLVIVVANLVASSPPFGKGSIFIMLMRVRGLDYKHNPLTQSLQRIAVSRAMDKAVVKLPANSSRQAARKILDKHPAWLVIVDQKQLYYLLPAADLAHALELSPEQTDFDLWEIPAHRLQLATLHFQATLQEALEHFERHEVEALCIVRPSKNTQSVTVLGVLTRTALENYYRT